MSERISDKDRYKIYDIIAIQMKEGEYIPRRIIETVLKEFNIQPTEYELDILIHTIITLFSMKIYEWDDQAIEAMVTTANEIKTRLYRTNTEII